MSRNILEFDNNIMFKEFCNKIDDYIAEEDNTALQNTLSQNSHEYIIQYLNNCDSEQRCAVLSNYCNITLLLKLEKWQLINLFNEIEAEKFSMLIKNFKTSDVFIIVQTLEEDQKIDIYDFLHGEQKELLKRVLSYDEDEVGRLIDYNVINIPISWTIHEVTVFLRHYRNLPEHVDNLFVMNELLQPMGYIKTIDLLRYDSRINVSDILMADFLIVEDKTDKEELVHIYSNHTTRPSFLVVINNNKEMKGVIYASELMKVAVDEAEEDILQLGGISKSDGLANSILGTVKTRLPWLCISFCAINLSSFVIGLFQDVLESNIYLAILMPVVAAMGGNAGLQASTIAVNAIAINSHNNLGILRTICKELAVGFINGFVLSIFIVAVIYFRYHDYNIGLIMAISMVLVFTFATLVGSIIPVLINKIKLDPSLSSSVMTSSCSDIIGFVSLFMTAKIILM